MRKFLKPLIVEWLGLVYFMMIHYATKKVTVLLYLLCYDSAIFILILAAFSLKSKSNDTNVYKMVNDNSYCVCMTNKENDPQLVSLSVVSIERQLDEKWRMLKRVQGRGEDK